MLVGRRRRGEKGPPPGRTEGLSRHLGPEPWPCQNNPAPHSSRITTASLSSHHGALHLYTCIVVQTVPQPVDTESPVSTSDPQHPAFRLEPRPHAALSTLSPSSPRVPDQSLLAFQPQVSSVLLGPDHGRRVHLRTLHLRPPTSYRCMPYRAARARSIVSLGLGFDQSVHCRIGLAPHRNTKSVFRAAPA